MPFFTLTSYCNGYITISGLNVGRLGVTVWQKRKYCILWL